MTIKQVYVFETAGRQFDTFKKAVDHREGLIEQFFRTLPGFNDMSPKNRIAFIQTVLDNRHKLTVLFDYLTEVPNSVED